MARVLAGVLSLWILVALYIPPLHDVSHPPREIGFVPASLALASLWYVPIGRRRDRFAAVAMIVAALILIDRLTLGAWWAWPLGTFLVVIGAIFIGLFAASFVIAGVMAFPGCEETAIPNLLGRSLRRDYVSQVHT